MKSQIMEGMMRVFIAERGMVMFVCMFVGGLQIPPRQNYEFFDNKLFYLVVPSSSDQVSFDVPASLIFAVLSTSDKLFKCSLCTCFSAPIFVYCTTRNGHFVST